jgi:hypothetical protein
LNRKTLAIIAIAGTASILGGCDRLPPPRPDVALCWSPSIKTGIEKMLHDEAVDIIFKEVDETAKEEQKPNTLTKTEISDRTTVSINTIHVVGMDAPVGSLECNANAAINFKRPDKILTAEGVAPAYHIFQSDGGHVFTTIGSNLIIKSILDKFE